MAKKQNKKGNLEVNVNMEAVLRGVKVLVQEKKKDVALRAAVGVSKAMPEIKAGFRNIAIHVGVEAGKAVVEGITGTSSGLVDTVTSFVHGGVMTNTVYNTVVGVNHFNKGYREATEEDVNKLLNPVLEAAKRCKEVVEETEVVEEIEENQELTEEEEAIKSSADTLRNLPDATIVDFMNNFALMQDEIKKLREELEKTKK